MEVLKIREDESNRQHRGCLLIFLLKVLRRTMKCHIFDLLHVEMDSLPSFQEYPEPGFSWDFIGVEDLLDFIGPEYVSISGKFIEDAFAQGDKCFAVLHEGKLAHYSWYSSASTSVMGNVRIEYPDDWVYMYNAYTHPDYRGMGLYPTAVARALKSLPADRFRACIALVNLDNPSSSSPMFKIGFSGLGKVLLIAAGKSMTYTDDKCLKKGVRLVRCT